MGLIDLLPDYYKNSTQVVELQVAFDHWAAAVVAAKTDLLHQSNIETATWGLDLWEKALNIKTDLSKSFIDRRSKIISKLRGLGTTTKEMIINVASSFANGEVTVIEYNSDSRFELKFVGTIGIPTTIEDISKAIDEIKPAHLAYSYVYIYRQNVQLTGFTHAVLGTYSHDNIRSGGME